MEKLVLIIGGNLGDRLLLINKTVDLLNHIFGPLDCASSIYESSPWGGKSLGNYLNQVLIYHTDLSPKRVLKKIQNIEDLLGRQREMKWGNRTMDIDILYYGEKTISSDLLRIPHPYIEVRKFVLMPLKEVLPDFIHPVLKMTNVQLFENCPDTSEIRIYEKSPG
jgi:2-amino-4-hydroxy-6-hydroxymethyldihydropteridine diphosphokinase